MNKRCPFFTQYKSQYDKSNTEEEVKGIFDHLPKTKTNDELRREELVKIMRDRSLSREEKAKRMDEVKVKYAAVPPIEKTEVVAVSQQQPSTSNEQQQKPKERVANKFRVSKYTPPKSLNESDGDDSQETMETAATTKVSVDLSAKSYAERRRASLESLENSICSNDTSGSGGGGRVMSVRERLMMYKNDEFVVKA